MFVFVSGHAYLCACVRNYMRICFCTRFVPIINCMCTLFAQPKHLRDLIGEELDKWGDRGALTSLHTSTSSNIIPHSHLTPRTHTHALTAALNLFQILTHTLADSHTHTHTHTHARIYICVRTLVRTHTYMHTHTHARTHAHSCRRSFRRPAPVGND